MCYGIWINFFRIHEPIDSFQAYCSLNYKNYDHGLKSKNKFNSRIPYQPLFSICSQVLEFYYLNVHENQSLPKT